MTTDPETWPELRAAQAEAEACHAAWAEAKRRLRCAPHGTLIKRQAEVSATNLAALRADLEVARLSRLAGVRA